MNKLFVYGIFLDEGMRKSYGMTNPDYGTVKDYATFGDYIVKAVHIPNSKLSLTGLLVDVDPKYWDALDKLERAYSRVIINVDTGMGEPIQAYIYKNKEIKQ